MFGALFTFLVDHLDLIESIYNIISSGKLTKAGVQSAIDKAVVAAGDAEMQREFPNGGSAA